MAYLTTALAKSDWLRIEAADTTMDALIGRMIAAAEEEIEGIINQPVESTTATIYWEGQGHLQQKLLYTVPVTAVALKSRATPLDSWTTIDASLYTVRKQPYGVAIWYKDYYTVNLEYEFTATVGWSSASVPADIQAAGYELVKELYYETPYAGQSERFGMSIITEGQGGTTFAKTIQRMRPLIAEKLAPYRMMVI